MLVKMSRLTTQDCWRTMLRGSEMSKLSGGKMCKRKLLKKTFYLEDDLSAINYRPKKKTGRIESSSIAQVIYNESVENSAQRYGEGSIPKDCSMALKFKSGKKLIIVATSQELAEIWRLGLSRLVEIGQKDPRKHEGRDRWLRNEFGRLAKTRGEVPFQEIVDFLPSLDIGIALQPMDLIEKMKKFQTRKVKDSLNVNGFVAFFNDTCTRKFEVSLLKGLASNGEALTPSDFEYFLTRIQGEPGITHDDCVQLIRQFEPTEEGRERTELTLEGLTRYFLSKEGDVFNKEHDSVYQDMTQPLNHYYIASSHNTYLMGDQLTGESSVQPYIEALKKGYRCVEIDCHDGKGGEPAVYHKHTLTTEVALKDVLSAIKENAFIASPYPVIISVENHCSVEVQKKMARYFETIFGDMLYKEVLDLSLHVAFPSPEFFKNRILIRGKKLKPDADDSRKSDCASSADTSSFEEKDSSLELEAKERPGPSKTEEKGKVDKSPDLKPPKHEQKTKIAHEFSRLINPMENKKFEGFEAVVKFYHSSSFSEAKLEKLLENSAPDFVEFNKKCTSRIYPVGTRFSSSNYDPQPAWNAGCQIVALNQQTNGEPTDLYLGRFRQNGRAGYNLKPRFLRDVECKFDPNSTHETAGIKSKILRVTIISADQLPPVLGGVGYKDIPDPYVITDIHGITADKFSHRTKTVLNNPFNPQWAENFRKKILNPELAMIRFSVYDADTGFDDFIGQFSLPLTSLQPGFRRVNLLNKEGEQLSGASLFIYTEFSLNPNQESVKVEPHSKCRMM